MYDAGDIRQVRRATKAARQAESDRRTVVFNLMSSPSGRAYAHDRLVRCHVFSSSFSTSNLAMAFAEGERNVGLQDLTDIMQFCPDQYVQMMREANDRNNASDSGPLRHSQDGDWRDSESPTSSGAASDYEPNPDDGAGDRDW